MSGSARWMRHQVLKAVRYGWSGLRLTVAHGIALSEQWRPAIRSTTQGSETLGPRVVLFCHWDSRGRVQEHTRRYVESLRAEGLSIVLSSNAESLAPGDAAWAASVCAVVILRRNVGYDFGAWRDALSACGLPRPETTQIILVNDSVYGPFRPLRDVLARIEASPAAICGLTDSWQRRYHLQSYFLSFRPEAFGSPAWRRFWDQVLLSRSKRYVVQSYEIGLTQALLRAELSCDVLWPYLDLVEHVRQEVAGRDPEAPADHLHLAADARILAAADGRFALNPTADLWSALMDNGFPFLKRELLRSNPSHVIDVARWREADAEEEAVVRRDLRVSMRHRTP